MGVLLLIPKLSGAADLNQEEILRQLEMLKSQIQAQQAHINKLESMLSEKADKKAEEKDGSKPAAAVTLKNTVIDGLELSGDLRVRYELRNLDDPNGPTDNRDRFRHRVRLGGVWKNKTENWEVGAGLATGGSDATSTNQTWGETSDFETGDIRLDYAYAKHKISDFAFTLGQQKNPLLGSWVIWDGDVRPTGLTAQYAHSLGLFATAGAYNVRYYINSNGKGANTAMLYAGQLGYEQKFGDISAVIAAGYQQYDSVFSNHEAPNPDYDFQVGDIYAEVTVPIGMVELASYAQIWQNFGVDGPVGSGQQGGALDPNDEDLGWIVGLEAKLMAFTLGYSYAVIEADSIYRGLIDADFGTGLNGTDVEGHRLSGFYNLTKNWSAGVIAQFFKAEERKQKADADLYQVDVQYKF
jgi:hypothetical protein